MKRFDALDYIDMSKKKLLLLIIKNQTIMSAELDKLEKEVQENGTVISSAVTLISGLKTELQAVKDELAAQGVTSAKLNELADALDANEQALAKAVAANTPGEEPIEEEPV